MEDAKKSETDKPQQATHRMPARYFIDPDPSHKGRPIDGPHEGEPTQPDASPKKTNT